MRTSHAPLGAALSLCLLLATPVHSATAGAESIYLDLPTAPGDSTEKNHLQWITLDSVSMTVARSASLAGGTRTLGRVNMSEFGWSQRLDSSVPLLIGAMVRPPNGEQGVFEIVGASAGKTAPVVRFETADAVVTSVSTDHDRVDASLGYTAVRMRYDLGGGPGNAGEITFDPARNRATGPTRRNPAPYTGTQPAAAPGGQTSMYLRLGEGATVIAGDAAAAGYENWIGIDSARWGVAVSYDPIRGGYSKPSFSDLSWTQTFDSATAIVLSDLLQGTVIGQSTLEYVRDAGAGPVTFMQLALDEVVFSGLSLTAGGGDFQATASLNFTRYSQTVWEILPDGTRGAATTVGYDLEIGQSFPGELARVPNGFGAGNLAAALPVPEPGTWAMLAAGLGVLLTVRRRRDRVGVSSRPAG